MMDSRKWYLAIAPIAFYLGLSFPVSAQNGGNAPVFTCAVSTTVVPQVRAEGVTELVGDIVLSCTGGIPTPAGSPIPLSNVTITLNTNVTSRLLNSNNLSEATLFIDEPFPTPAEGGIPVPTTASQVPNAPQGQLACAAVNSTNCAMLGVGVLGISVPLIVKNGAKFGLPTIGPVGNNGPYNGTPGRYNVFQGSQVGAASIAWNGVPIDSPGTNGAGQLNVRVIRITNIRANACQLGVSANLIPAAISVFITVNGSQQVSLSTNVLNVASVVPGLVVGSGSATYLQCTSVNGGGLTAPPINVTVTEGFASAFKVRTYDQVAGTGVTLATPDTDSTPSLQNVPGFPYNTESGYVATPGLGPGATGFGLTPGSVGLADTGTEFSVTIANVGAGVNLFVPSQISLAPAGGTQTGVAYLAGTNGSGGSTQATVTGNTATIVYEVVFSSVNVIETATIPVTVVFASVPTANLPGLGTSTAAVNFYPIATVQTASATAPIPRFCATHSPANIFTINSCTCNLLFPFVTNTAGFDSGIAIANTTQDPFGTGPQAGTVTLYYYGTTTGGGAAPPSQTSQSVSGGSELIFNLSSGGNLGVSATPGFEGYIIALARFQYCHAFAFISDLGAQRLAEGYLAIQLDLPVVSITPTPIVGLNRTGQAGENEGH
jgi:hypothetical protein